MPERSYKTLSKIDADLLDLKDLDLDLLVIEDSNIRELILPLTLKSFITYDSVIRRIVVHKNIETMSCEETGIEELVAEDPLDNARTLMLNDNKLTKLDMKLKKLFTMDISNNDIGEIVHKIPFCWDFNDEGNPIINEQKTTDYILY